MPTQPRWDPLRRAIAGGIPVLLLLTYVLAHALHAAPGPGRASAPRAPLKTDPPTAQTIILILDSMGQSNATDPTLMPHLMALSKEGLSGPLASCHANFTLPCLLTAFEGRESPFSKALSNFSGSSSANSNVFDSLRDAGLRIAIVADHTLPELYPGVWAAGGTYEQAEIPIEKRDAYAQERVLGWMAARQHDIIVGHVIGTDKISHTEPPGSPEYTRVFQQADRFVAEIRRAMQPQDHLLVFGDHGHGAGGHHTRRAWYTLVGAGVAQATLPLRQTTIPYLIARLHNLTLPRDYEGQLPWSAFSNDPNEATWRQHQAAVWGSDSADRAAIDAAYAALASTRQGQPTTDALAFLPWALQLLLIIAALANLQTHPLRRGWIRAQLAFLALAFALGPLAAWLTLPLQAALSRPPWRGPLGLGALALWSGLALASGLVIPTLFAFFHVKTGTSWVIGLWFGIMLTLPPAAALLYRGPNRLAVAVLVTAAAAALLPAPGIYYYGVAQNICHLVLPLTVLGFAALRRPKTARDIALLALMATALAFVPVRAGGWEWRFRLQLWVAHSPLWLQYAAAIAGPVLAAFTWGLRHPLQKALALTLTLLYGYSLATFFAYEPWHLAPFGIAIAATAATARLWVTAKTDSKALNAFAAAFVAALFFVVAWSAVNGLYIRNFRLDFALSHIGKLFNNESTLAIAVGALAVLRYLGVIALPTLAAAFAAGRQRLLHLGHAVLWILSAKLLADALRVVSVQFIQNEKSSELVLQEALGVGFVAILLWLTLTAIAAQSHLAQRPQTRTAPL